MVGRCRHFPHDLRELIMSIGPLCDRKDGNAHRLPFAAAGTEMCSMEEGLERHAISMDCARPRSIGVTS